jgi:hypothetical protein
MQIDSVFPCSAVFGNTRVPKLFWGSPEHRNTAFSAGLPCSGGRVPEVVFSDFRNTAEKAVFRCSLYIGGRVPEHGPTYRVLAAPGGLAA